MEEGIWLSILEYANYRSMSISTVRRYIKAQRIKFQKTEGKYFIWVSKDNVQKKKDNERESEKLFSANLQKIEKYQEEIRILREENQDLRMLVDIYEKQLQVLRSGQVDLPQIPLDPLQLNP